MHLVSLAYQLDTVESQLRKESWTEELFRSELLLDIHVWTFSCQQIDVRKLSPLCMGGTIPRQVVLSCLRKLFKDEPLPTTQIVSQQFLQGCCLWVPAWTLVLSFCSDFSHWWFVTLTGMPNQPFSLQVTLGYSTL